MPALSDRLIAMALVSVVVLGCGAYARRLRARAPGRYTGVWRFWGEQEPRRQLAACAGLLVGTLALAAIEGLLPGAVRGDGFRWASLTALLVTLAVIVGASLRKLGRRIADRERER
jgi:uncharacterized membrane protein